MKLATIFFVEFQEWFAAKYVNWRGDAIGNEGSQAAFARWLKLSPQLIGAWLKGRKKPESAESIHRLVERFGGEVYDVLDIAPQEFVPSDDELRPIAEMILQFPQHLRPRVRQAIQDSLAAVIDKEITPDQVDREVVRRLSEILEADPSKQHE